MLAIVPKARGFKPGGGDGFLRTKKSAAHLPSDGSKAGRSHVVRLHGTLKNPTNVKEVLRRQNP
jgi:hypothetical protein